MYFTLHPWVPSSVEALLSSNALICTSTPFGHQDSGLYFARKFRFDGAPILRYPVRKFNVETVVFGLAYQARASTAGLPSPPSKSDVSSRASSAGKAVGKDILIDSPSGEINVQAILNGLEKLGTRLNGAPCSVALTFVLHALLVALVARVHLCFRTGIVGEPPLVRQLPRLSILESPLEYMESFLLTCSLRRLARLVFAIVYRRLVCDFARMIESRHSGKWQIPSHRSWYC
jgi:hypothetical protein